MSYQRLVCQDKRQVLRASTLAEFAVKRVRAGRRVGSSQNSADVLARWSKRSSEFQVHSLTAPADDQDNWNDTLVECRQISPSELAAFRVDFAQWMEGFAERDRRIISALASGEGTKQWQCASG